MRFNRVPQRMLRQDTILISSPDFLTLDKTILFKVRDDSLYGSLRYADLESNFPQDQG